MLPGEEIRRTVRQHYAGLAEHRECCRATSCCPPVVAVDPAIPSLGCGSPLIYADVRWGETVLDLGSGAGGDVLMAAQRVGPTGRAIGVDMTPEMIRRARDNARRVGADNTEFRLGEIEDLPVSRESVDVVISNCVINLAPDKARVFREAYRVLKPGGRLVVADMVSRGPLPEAIRTDTQAWAKCIAGAVDLDEYVALMRAAGFTAVEVLAAGEAAAGQVFSATLRAMKPPLSPPHAQR